ncbi:MAG TPA: hypothetical protein VNO43_02390 [Candidatus Eisenbacteria bacterium]|nr:hypothetical protein [Candidatus Eisenbacteria bacterium]
MADTIKAKIGFISGGASSMPHYASFTPLIPSSIRIDFEGLGLYSRSLYEIENKKDVIIDRVLELAARHAWDGVIVSAAPTEVLNPGLYDDLRAALRVPFTTALHACAAALRAYSASRVLLLTPFDRRLNDLICRHLEKKGITATAPHPFENLDMPKRMAPGEVFELARRALQETGVQDAIYFQGAVLDPIKAIEKIERELKTSVIASNPAMLWYILEKLQIASPIPGYGRLLAEWPAAPQEP